jgi:hypothetical protein
MDNDLPNFIAAAFMDDGRQGNKRLARLEKR